MAVAICERGSRKPAAEETVPACQEWRSGCRQRFSVTTVQAVDRQVRRGRTEPSRAVDRAQGGDSGTRRPVPGQPCGGQLAPSRTSGWENTTALSLRTMCGGQNFMRLRREPQKRPASAAPVEDNPFRHHSCALHPPGPSRPGGTEDFQNTINPGYPPISAVHAIIAGGSQTPRCHYCISFDKRNLSVVTRVTT